MVHHGTTFRLSVAVAEQESPVKSHLCLPTIVMGLLPLALLTGCLSRQYDLFETKDGGVGDGSAAEHREAGRDSFLETARSDAGISETSAFETGISEVSVVEAGDNLPEDAQVENTDVDAPVVLPPDGGTDAPILVPRVDTGIEAPGVKSDVPVDTNRTTNPDGSRDVTIVLDVPPDVTPGTPPDTSRPPLLDAPIDAPTTGCTIGGTPYASGATNLDNVCLVCAPSATSTAWSNNADNTPCPTGYCQSGTCTSGCLIGTTFHASGAINTGVNACQSCQPSVSATAWSPLAPGADCATGVCNAGACADGCWLGGGFVGNVNRNPDNQCQDCQPSVNTKAWQTLNNGAGCGTGKVCAGGGACSDGCWLNSALVLDGGINPGNDCQECKPLVSTSQWQPRAEGTLCGTGTQICSAGSCQTGCWIAGAFHASGAINPSNQCESCAPSLSLTAWTQRGAQECSIITAGQHYTCAAVGGSAKCWGANGSGTLGDGTNTRQTSPVQVTGLTSGVRAISSAGDSYHTCALVNGGVQCWGRNSHGELGNNPMASSLVPVPVDGLSSGVIGLSVGGNHSCALLTGGSLRCWGWNISGALGLDPLETLEAYVPGAPVAGLGGPVQAVALGQEHTCALVGGGVKCWGSNTDGQLGNPLALDPSFTPVSVALLTSGVQAISTSRRHTCALVNGEVRCWGNGGNGRLGNDSTANSPVPVSVLGLPGPAQAIAAGGSHSCAVVSGNVYCWGGNS
jgi:hypothetical protein